MLQVWALTPELTSLTIATTMEHAARISIWYSYIKDHSERGGKRTLAHGLLVLWWLSRLKEWCECSAGLMASCRSSFLPGCPCPASKETSGRWLGDTTLGLGGTLLRRCDEKCTCYAWLWKLGHVVHSMGIVRWTQATSFSSPPSLSATLPSSQNALLPGPFLLALTLQNQA